MRVFGAQVEKNPFVSAGEGEFLQFGQRKPTALLFCRRSQRFESVQGNPVARNRVLDGAERANVAREETEASSGGGFEGRLIPIQFNVWKFPKVRVDDSSGSLTDEHTTIVPCHERGEPSFGRAGASAEIGKLGGLAGFECHAKARDGTFSALGLARRADQRAEFHEGLVELRAGLLLLVLRSRPRPRNA